MKVIVESRRKSQKNLEKKYPNALILDVTSKGEMPWVQFSPFYPIQDIPIPFSENATATCVEGIWQGLKVFENFDIDSSKFDITKMKGIKRTVRKYGKVLGHRKGVLGKELLDYQTARNLIYLPSYKWVLENRLQQELLQIQQYLETQDVLLLDYETNTDIFDLSAPLSHASLIQRYLEKKWPSF